MMQKMGAGELLDDLHLTIEFKYKEGYSGECVVYNKDRGFPQFCKILINPVFNRTKHDVIATLGHELAHLKQFCRKEIVIRKNHWIYNGKRVSLQNEYYTFPWEIEAAGWGHNLALLYRRAVSEKAL